MNKKILCLLSIGLVVASFAQARDYAYTPYVGADYSYTLAHAKGLHPAYQGADVNLGSRYNDYFGTELFYQQTGSDAKKIDTATKYKSSYRAYGLDMAVYLPLGCAHRLDVFATAGLGEYVFAKKISGQKHRHDSGFGYRFGGGLLYNLTEHVSFRLLARHIELDKISSYDHMTEYLAGLRYYF